MENNQYSITIILVFILRYFCITVSSHELEKFYVPTQEHFVAQQSLLHHKGTSFPNFNPQVSFGWPSIQFPPGQGIVGVNTGAATSTPGSGSSAIANAASGFTFGLIPNNNNNQQQQQQLQQQFQLQQQLQQQQFQQQLQQLQQQQQLQLQLQQPPFFGGTFGLGFGFGGGWYPYPLIPPNIQNNQQKPQQSQQQSSASASASASVGQLLKPIDLQFTNTGIPMLLKPSHTGWDTSYNVPCGTYQIRPFVVANLRLATGSSPFFPSKRRKRRSAFKFDDEKLWDNTETLNRNLPSYFPPNPNFPFPNIPKPVNPPPNKEGKTCSWTFNSDGPCKLKFRCIWFQLPTLFSCSENFMQVTDATPNLNNTFCGNRKPRQVYNSSSGKLLLTFRSQTSSLPAVFDCAVTCTLESSPNEGKPERKVISLKDANSTSPTENEFGYSGSTEKVKSEENPRIRIGDCKCGVRDDHYTSKGRIVGGQPTSPTEFSWTVALVRKTFLSKPSRPFCSGSLISDTYVLTAAHCVSNNKIIREPRSLSESKSLKDLFDVLLLEHDVNRVDEVPGGSLRIGVDKIIVHPKYDNVSFNYDIALIKLNKPVEFNPSPSYFRYDTFDFHSQKGRLIPEVEARPHLPRPIPICLPSDKDTDLEGKYGTITGWGLQHEGGTPSDELLKATVQIFNDSLCKDIYKEYNYPVTESMICAGYLAGKVDACVGDSGGGLMIEDNKGRYVLAGITSWGRGCGRKRQPGVFTKVGKKGLTHWIQTQANDGIWCL